TLRSLQACPPAVAALPMSPSRHDRSIVSGHLEVSTDWQEAWMGANKIRTIERPEPNKPMVPPGTKLVPAPAPPHGPAHNGTPGGAGPSAEALWRSAHPR